MPAFNPQNEDKRLKQDDVEREKKANSSLGMLVAVIVILIAIIAGAYLYNRSTVQTGTVNQENNVVAQPVAPATMEQNQAPAPTDSMPSSTESMPSSTESTPSSTDTTPSSTESTPPSTSDMPTSNAPADGSTPSDTNAQ